MVIPDWLHAFLPVWILVATGLAVGCLPARWSHAVGFLAAAAQLAVILFFSLGGPIGVEGSGNHEANDTGTRPVPAYSAEVRVDGVARAGSVLVPLVGLPLCLALPTVRLASPSVLAATLLVAQGGILLQLISGSYALLFGGFALALGALVCMPRAAIQTPEGSRAARLLLASFELAVVLAAAGFAWLIWESGSHFVRPVADWPRMPHPLAIACLMFAGAIPLACAPAHTWAAQAAARLPREVSLLLIPMAQIAGIALLLRGLDLVADMDASPAGEAIRVSLLLLALLSCVLGGVGAINTASIEGLMVCLAMIQAGCWLGCLALPGAEGSTERLTALAWLICSGTLSWSTASLLLIGIFREAPSLASMGHLAGLARQAPWGMACLLVLLAGVAGLPPTAAVWGRYRMVLDAGRPSPHVERMLLLAGAVVLSMGFAMVALRRLGRRSLRAPATDLIRSPGWMEVGVATVVAGGLVLFGVWPEAFQTLQALRWH